METATVKKNIFFSQLSHKTDFISVSSEISHPYWDIYYTIENFCPLSPILTILNHPQTQQRCNIPHTHPINSFLTALYSLQVISPLHRLITFSLLALNEVPPTCSLHPIPFSPSQNLGLTLTNCQLHQNHVTADSCRHILRDFKRILSFLSQEVKHSGPETSRNLQLVYGPALTLLPQQFIQNTAIQYTTYLHLVLATGGSLNWFYTVLWYSVILWYSPTMLWLTQGHPAFRTWSNHDVLILAKYFLLTSSPQYHLRAIWHSDQTVYLWHRCPEQFYHKLNCEGSGCKPLIKCFGVTALSKLLILISDCQLFSPVTLVKPRRDTWVNYLIPHHVSRPYVSYSTRRNHCVPALCAP